MSNNNNQDLLNTPEEDKRFRVKPEIIKNIPGPFPDIQFESQNVGQKHTPFFDELHKKERSLIIEEDKEKEKNKKKGGSVKYRKRLSYKNKKRISRKIRKSHRNKKHYTALKIYTVEDFNPQCG